LIIRFKPHLLKKSHSQLLKKLRHQRPKNNLTEEKGTTTKNEESANTTVREREEKVTEDPTTTMAKRESTSQSINKKNLKKLPMINPAQSHLHPKTGTSDNKRSVSCKMRDLSLLASLNQKLTIKKKFMNTSTERNSIITTTNKDQELDVESK
jgi:hypothetical protein